MSTGRKSSDRGRGTDRDRDLERAVPRMPHEHDQSSDSQQSEPRKVIEKAYRDIEEGRQDTDRRSIRGYEKPENRLLKESPKEENPKEENAKGGKKEGHDVRRGR